MRRWGHSKEVVQGEEEEKNKVENKDEIQKQKANKVGPEEKKPVKNRTLSGQPVGCS